MAETLNVKSPVAVNPIRLTALALAASLAACSVFDSTPSGERTDYRGAPVAKSKSLEVPPDLTQLARESRYQVQGGVVTASGSAGGPAVGAAPAAVAAAAAAAPASGAAPGSYRFERSGQQRWLVAPVAPEQLWPQIKAFWEQRGFALETEDAANGLMETSWSENRAKLPNDVMRNTLGRVLGGLYDTGERDRYRTRLERTASGSEIYVAHRGIKEVAADERQETFRWRARPSDPELEAEMLSRLMLALAPRTEPERARAQVANAPEVAARARAVGPDAALEVDEPFDRAWRRVGLALDRGGFTVEDRDRNAGLFYVRYVDPKAGGMEEPSWWNKLLGDKNNPLAIVKYRIALKGNGDKTTVSVQTSAGGVESGENGKNIAATLVRELR